MGRKERQAVKDAVNDAKKIKADKGDDFEYEASQQRIRAAEKAAGRVGSWAARQGTY